MAWWDGDAIDYNSDWYQENDSNWNGINTGGEQEYIPNDGGWDGVNTPEGNWSDMGGELPQDNNNFFGGIDTTGVQTDTGPTWNAPNAGGVQNALAGIFSGAQNNPLVGKGLAAVMEGYQNKRKQSAMNNIAKNPALDPFGSQRGFYQQQAQQAVTNPYDSPIVKAQITQLQNAQNIKDAAAGRRSNQLTSSPAVMAEMAKIAQQYQQQMATQGGAGIAPNSSAMTQAQMAGVNSGVNSYISPLMQLLGNKQQSSANQSALQKFLAGG